MVQPSIPGTGIGKPVMPYGSDGSDWIALLVDAVGRLQVDADVDNFPADPATQTTLLAILAGCNVFPARSTAWTQAAVTIGTSAGVIKASNTDRIGVTIFNLGAETIYVGEDNTVTTVNGYPILSNSSLYIEGYTGDIYGISGTAGQDVRYLEI